MEEKKNHEKFASVSIPISLAEKIEKRIKGTEFSSISAYITFVLEEVVSDEEEDNEELSKEDDERIKARLRSLGYLD